jgi:hypothetical protein
MYAEIKNESNQKINFDVVQPVVFRVHLFKVIIITNYKLNYS